MNKKTKTKKKYKSSDKVLADYFEGSRDKWRGRSVKYQKKADYLEIKVRDLEKSRTEWKAKAKDSQKKLKEIQAKKQKDSEAFSSCLDLIPMKEEKHQVLSGELIPATPNLPNKAGHEGFIHPLAIPTYHQHTYLAIYLGINMYIKALTSLRGGIINFELFEEFFSFGGIPSLVTLQNWVLRLAIYELESQKSYREDWIIILDSSIKMGTMKCLLIIGIPEADVIKKQYRLRHDDFTVLKLIVSETLTGEIIDAHLESLSKEIGEARQIISDGGPDIAKAKRLHAKTHEAVMLTYDITHKLALFLKKLLDKEERWENFTSLCGKLRSQIQQTPLAYLLPPNQRSKARYMNINSLVTWAIHTINYIERSDFSLLKKGFSLDDESCSVVEKVIGKSVAEPLRNAHFPTQAAFIQHLEAQIGVEKTHKHKSLLLYHADVGRKYIMKYFSWMMDFKPQIAQYAELNALVITAEKIVKKEGLSQMSADTFKEKTKAFPLISAQAVTLKNNVEGFLIEESEKIKEGETKLGSSDIIESIFGKYKLFDARSPLAGIGKMILSIPCFMTKITFEKIQKAFNEVKHADIKRWISENLGRSILSQRLEAFGGKNRQKLDENCAEFLASF